jgi:hypothetical protein
MFPFPVGLGWLALFVFRAGKFFCQTFASPIPFCVAIKRAALLLRHPAFTGFSGILVFV